MITTLIDPRPTPRGLRLLEKVYVFLTDFFYIQKSYIKATCLHTKKHTLAYKFTYNFPLIINTYLQFITHFLTRTHVILCVGARVYAYIYVYFLHTWVYYD